MEKFSISRLKTSSKYALIALVLRVMIEPTYGQTLASAITSMQDCSREPDIADIAWCVKEPGPYRIRRAVFRIPDFEEAQSNTEEYGWFVASFHDNASALGPASVDTDGTLSANIPIKILIAPDGTTTQRLDSYYIYSVNRLSGEIRYSLDLKDVNLVALLESLNNARATTAPHLPQAGRLVSRPNNVGDANLFVEVRLDIRSRQMTLEQVLALIHVQTSCRIFRDRENLVITNCE